MSTDRVARFELFNVPPRWVFLRLETEQGVVGWGEPSLEGMSGAAAATTAELMEEVIGEDPSRIQAIWQKLSKCKFYGGAGPIFMSALAGIDQALWDIKGRTLGVPVHQLLGGAVRDRLAVYRWCGGDNNRPEEAAEEAASVIRESNFRNLKMNACAPMPYVDTVGAVKGAEARMAAVRDAVGPDIGIALDFHGRCKLPMVKRLMEALAPYEPLFFEEPVTPGFNKNLPAIRAATSVPIATGERMYTAGEFLSLLSAGGADIIQPDLSHAGGISHVFDIARIAEHHDVAIAPHCPLGPIALASCLQIDFCAINAVFQECSLGIHYNQEGGVDILHYLENPKVFEVDSEGFVSLPAGAGLGVEVDEAAVREAAKSGSNWKDRFWQLADGAATKW